MNFQKREIDSMGGEDNGRERGVVAGAILVKSIAPQDVREYRKSASKPVSDCEISRLVRIHVCWGCNSDFGWDGGTAIN
jgi:hypothetical protein